MDNVHSKDSRTPTLVHKGTAYTLYYSQPWPSIHEPHGVIWESKEKHFTARDETEAVRIMDDFLSIGMLEIVTGRYTGKHTRKAKLLITRHPYRVIREYFPREMLSPTGS